MARIIAATKLKIGDSTRVDVKTRNHAGTKRSAVSLAREIRSLDASLSQGLKAPASVHPRGSAGCLHLQLQAHPAPLHRYSFASRSSCRHAPTAIDLPSAAPF